MQRLHRFPLVACGEINWLGFVLNAVAILLLQKNSKCNPGNVNLVEGKEMDPPNWFPLSPLLSILKI